MTRSEVWIGAGSGCYQPPPPPPPPPPPEEPPEDPDDEPGATDEAAIAELNEFASVFEKCLPERMRPWYQPGCE
jgi:hypothetical protein